MVFLPQSRIGTKGFELFESTSPVDRARKIVRESFCQAQPFLLKFAFLSTVSTQGKSAAHAGRMADCGGSISIERKRRDIVYLSSVVSEDWLNAFIVAIWLLFGPSLLALRPPRFQTPAGNARDGESATGWTRRGLVLRYRPGKMEDNV